MRPPVKDSIKAAEGKYYVIRKASYNGRTTEKVEWQVAEKLNVSAYHALLGHTTNLWRLEREFSTKRDAMHWLYVCAGV